MNKFNTQLHIEETNDYHIGELMNELNNDIQVNDKVQWIAFNGDKDIVIKGRVLSISQFNDEKNFVVRVLGKEDTHTTLHHSRVTKV
tara:strand:- start:654 stop:914 length:261 start_codon:yes stop_codon:yes gene_type:complete